MFCFPSKSPFCKRLEYLLGPLNGFSQPELKLYKLAALTLVGGKNNTKHEGCSFEVYNEIDKQEPKLFLVSLNKTQNSETHFIKDCVELPTSDCADRITCNPVVCNRKAFKGTAGKWSQTSHCKQSYTIRPPRTICEEIGNGDYSALCQLKKTSMDSSEDILLESMKGNNSQKQKEDTLEIAVDSSEIHGGNSAMSTAEIWGLHLFIPCTSFHPEIFCQNYRKWKAGMDLSFRLHQCRKKAKIYILPIDHFPDFIMDAEDPSQSSFFKVLKRFAEIFFLGFEIELLPGLDSLRTGWQITMRKHQVTEQNQQLVSDFYPYLRQVLPKDGYCILGISWTDLYPSEELNFVLGEASSLYSSAMFCFGRYEPKAYSGDDAVKQINGDLFWKLFRVMSHETCHLFGIQHCVYFSCAMNESKSLDEALSQPLLLCPVCLRKMQKVCRFDLLQRYSLMSEFLQTQIPHHNENIKETIAWLERAVIYCTTNQLS